MFTVYKADSRGLSQAPWLQSYHSFSFSNYYDPSRMGFGSLLVLNDDVIKGGTDFPPHPHRDMEIISIPLTGGLTHMDSLGNKAEITPNMIQVMSAGTGIKHAEYNSFVDQDTAFLQIWIQPHTNNVDPRHVEKEIDYKTNSLTLLASPSEGNGGVVIYQDAYVWRGIYNKGETITHQGKSPTSKFFIFVIDGTVTVGDKTLNKRDACEIVDEKEIQLIASTDCDFLLFDLQ